MSVEHLSVYVGPVFKADVLCAFLSANGVNARVADDRLAVLGEAYGSGEVFSARVVVPAPEADRARDLLAQRDDRDDSSESADVESERLEPVMPTRLLLVTALVWLLSLGAIFLCLALFWPSS